MLTDRREPSVALPLKVLPGRSIFSRTATSKERPCEGPSRLRPTGPRWADQQVGMHWLGGGLPE